MVKLALKHIIIDILTPNMVDNKELVLDILKKDPSECKYLFSLKYVNDLDVMKTLSNMIINYSIIVIILLILKF